jgi:hypothetical protein
LLAWGGGYQTLAREMSRHAFAGVTIYSVSECIMSIQVP